MLYQLPVDNGKNQMKKKDLYLLSPIWLKTILLSFENTIRLRARENNKFPEYYKLLIESQKWSTQDIYSYQLKQFKKLVHECYLYSDYYQTVFKKYNLEINSINSIKESLNKLPFLEKSIIRDNRESLINKNPARKVKLYSVTSGTSGMPLKVPHDHDSLNFAWAIWKSYHHSLGLGLKPRSVRFSGNQLISPDRKIKPFWIEDIFNNQLFLSTFHLNEENTKHYVAKLNQYKPELMDGYPSAISNFADLISNGGFKLNFTPKAIVTTAETLYPSQREKIKSVFNCNVYNQYSFSEGGPLIADCSHGNLHLYPQTGIFEFLDINGNPAEPGSTAELVITSLRNWKLPLIRYKTGDMVKLPSDPEKLCSCGSHLPLIDEIVGRSEDILVSSNGSLISIANELIFKNMSNVKNSQFIQEKPGSLMVNVVKNTEFDDKDVHVMMKNLKRVFGSEMKFEINYMDEIKLTGSGKLKASIRKFPLS